MKRLSGIISVLSLALVLMLQGCEPPVPDSVSVSPASVTIPQNGGSSSVEVNATAQWSLSNSASWLKTDAVGGTGSQTLVLTAEANDTYESRTAVINFVCGDKNASLTVTQPGQTPKVSVDVNMMTALPKGGTLKIKATCPTGAVSVSEMSDWITLESTNEDTFSFTAKANYTGEERTGNIVFASAGAESATVQVQQKGIVPEFKIRPSAITIGKTGGNVRVIVTANMGYHTEGVSDWIEEKSSRTLSDNTYEHIYAIAENATGEARTGVISFCNEIGLCVPLVVEQSGEDDSGQYFAREFLHKSLFMRFTATWCGYCPMMAAAIASAREELPGKIEQVCLHGGGSELEFAPTTSLMNQYGVGGFPSGVVDGRAFINNASKISSTAAAIVSAVQETENTYPVVTGVAMSTELSGGVLSAQVKVYVKAAGKYKITALILEDDIDKAQVDYNDGNHDSYNHSDVARVALTAIKGDAFTIENDDTVKEFIYSSPVSAAFNPEKLRVLVYIQREFGDQPVIASGKYGGYYVDNAASVKAGSSLDLQFAK